LFYVDYLFEVDYLFDVDYLFEVDYLLIYIDDIFFTTILVYLV